MVSISTTVTLPDDRVEEAIADLLRLNDPSNIITYNDGWFARSLVKKWKMDLQTLEALVKAARQQRVPLLYRPNNISEQELAEITIQATELLMLKLEQYIVEKRLPFQTVEWFGEQIADRIKELHRRGRATY